MLAMDEEKKSAPWSDNPAFYTLNGAVKEIDGGPEQIVEVRFEPRVAERRDQGIEVGDRARDGIAFGKRSRIRFVVEGMVAVELKLGQNVVGRGMSCALVRIRCRRGRSLSPAEESWCRR